ncbi:MAG: hypothetical protein ACK587_12455 [Cyanobacteriota bacterium]
MELRQLEQHLQQLNHSLGITMQQDKKSCLNENAWATYDVEAARETQHQVGFE